MSDGENTRARLAAAGGRVLASRLLRAVFLLLAAILCGFAIAGQWPDVRVAFGRLGAASLLASFAVTFGTLICAMMVWRALLADLGSPLPLRLTTRVFFLSQLSKYVPGSVWPLLAQMELGRDAGVPRRRSAATFFLSLVVANASGLFVVCLTLPLLHGYGPEWFRWLLFASPVLVGVAHPRVLNPLLEWALRIARQEAPERRLSVRGVAIAYLWSILGWGVAGLHVALLAFDLGATGPGTWLLAAGGFTLAWCAGFAVVVLPAGAGVRDLALAAALAPVLGTGAAFVVAIVSRLFLTVSDFLTALFGLLVTPRVRRQLVTGPKRDR